LNDKLDCFITNEISNTQMETLNTSPLSFLKLYYTGHITEPIEKKNEKRNLYISVISTASQTGISHLPRH